jgi:hypothetical protein
VPAGSSLPTRSADTGLLANLDVQAFDFLIKRGERDVELLSGVGLIPIAALKFFNDDAALDVFEQEPVDPANPLLTMDNVIVTPHSLCWTDECFHNMASTGLASIVDALGGRRPEFVVNPEVLAHARVRALGMR